MTLGKPISRSAYGKRADMVPRGRGVRDDRLDVIGPHLFEIRQDEVDAEHLRVGNIRPVSTTTIGCGGTPITIMFLPISPVRRGEAA